jgi:hypothetical protein
MPKFLIEREISGVGQLTLPTRASSHFAKILRDFDRTWSSDSLGSELCDG